MLRVALILTLLGARPALAEEDCPWREPKETRFFGNEGGTIVFRSPIDPYWFRCARRGGGTLTLRIFSGREGKLTLFRTHEVRSYSVNERIGTGRLCEADPPPTEVQVTLTGTGPMERLTYKSDIVGIFCPRCTFRSYNHMLALRMGRRVAPRGKALLVGTLDPEWHRCARSGSTLAMQFFAGETYQEVRGATEPIFAVKGLERKARFKKAIPMRLLCKGKPRFIGYEYVGTGEMQSMNRMGRSIQGIHCRGR